MIELASATLVGTPLASRVAKPCPARLPSAPNLATSTWVGAGPLAGV